VTVVVLVVLQGKGGGDEGGEVIYCFRMTSVYLKYYFLLLLMFIFINCCCFDLCAVMSSWWKIGLKLRQKNGASGLFAVLLYEMSVWHFKPLICAWAQVGSSGNCVSVC
jgi:hypothetical protein